MGAPVPIRHVLNLLYSDMEALVASAAHLQPGDRHLALEILAAGLWHLRARPGAELVRAEKSIDGRAILR